MALSNWKTNKNTPKTQPTATHHTGTGGGVPPIAKIATIAIAAEDYKSSHTQSTDPIQAQGNNNSEPVKGTVHDTAFYQSLVSCQQCANLDTEAYCQAVARYPIVEALRACESFKQAIQARTPIKTTPLTPQHLAYCLEEAAKPLLWHLVTCTKCFFQDSQYCTSAKAIGEAYEDALMMVDDIPKHRDELLTRVIKARKRNQRDIYR